jgi:hypothetical protein
MLKFVCRCQAHQPTQPLLGGVNCGRMWKKDMPTRYVVPIRHIALISTRYLSLQVRAAAEKAAEELRRANPKIDHEAIKVDIPVAPPPNPAAAGHRAVPAPVINPRQALLQQQAAQLRLQQEIQRQRVLDEARRQ